jgi:hypothetical protein
MVNVGNWLFGVNDKFSIELPVSKDGLIKNMDFGLNSIIYFDS